MSYIENPKTKGSGIICCIPQTGRCPNNCPDCFYQSGRSYLEPLEDNLPNIPPKELTHGRVVRVNDGHDSAFDINRVLEVTDQFEDKFFNTSSPFGPDLLKWATVVTVNPGEITDSYFNQVTSPYLMYVRARANLWNLELLEKIIDFYALKRSISVIITWMNYHTADSIPVEYRRFYDVKTHVTNAYYSPTAEGLRLADYLFTVPGVYECGKQCKDCGNCLREYFAWKEKYHWSIKGSNAAHFRV